MKKIIFFYLIFFYTRIFSLDFINFPFSGMNNKLKDNHYIGYNIYFSRGTHISGTGFDIYSYLITNINYNKINIINLLSFYRISFIYYDSYLGIPGKSLNYNLNTIISIGFGKNKNLPVKSYLINFSSILNFYYGITFYYSTDKTNQSVGTIGLIIIYNNSRIKIQHDNDLFTFTKDDQFRTAAFELEYLYFIKDLVIGANFGFKLWAGTRKGLKRLKRGEYYDLSNQYGGKYSNGILYFSIFLNGFEFSIGFDSEDIRDKIQNTTHFIIGAGFIPKLNRENRIYIELIINDFEKLY